MIRLAADYASKTGKAAQRTFPKLWTRGKVSRLSNGCGLIVKYSPHFWLTQDHVKRARLARSKINKERRAYRQPKFH